MTIKPVRSPQRQAARVANRTAAAGNVKLPGVKLPKSAANGVPMPKVVRTTRGKRTGKAPPTASSSAVRRVKK